MIIEEVLFQKVAKEVLTELIETATLSPQEIERIHPWRRRVLFCLKDAAERKLSEISKTEIETIKEPKECDWNEKCDKNEKIMCKINV